MPSTYIGFDLSSSGLKCLAVTADLKAIHEEAILFDKDLPHYGVVGGVHKNEKEKEVYAPVAMWIEALDLILTRMKEGGFDFSSVRGVSGAGQQHGSVYWSDKAEQILASLNPNSSLVEQLSPDGFTHKWSPNWQDHSTQTECEQFEQAAGDGEALARITGSRAHHRFTGPQIKKFHRRHPEVYEKTARISLVSSFLCSIFLGRIAPLDISDVCGMNLWDIKNDDWDQSLLTLTTEGEKGGVAALTAKLGDVERTHGKNLGKISPWFVDRFGFSPECAILPFTGDNPATILALPLRPLDAIVSLGTSTTLLMSTPTYYSSVEYHLFNHPTTRGLYMFMLCYCNGALAREGIRNQVNKASNISSGTWDAFDAAAVSTPMAGKKSPSDPAKIGVYFPLPENIPNVRDGTWRFIYKDGKVEQTEEGWDIPRDDVRAILEGQALSMRMRSEALLAPDPKVNGNKAQPRRLYFVGGGSRNTAIMQIMAEVLGGFEGVYKLDIGSNACALGAAYYATWALERKEGEAFEDYVADWWDEENQVKRIGDSYKEGVWEEYGELLKGFRLAEEKLVKIAHN
ncbi:hypothetical protein FN846DRAFT_921904 [Sphaerosporella brunnea]|uniref:Xylulose kinase n=1 Tax=Sphaerosporella brunnea TaxID=1250544 RepID=A0A5J5EK41_9PEZI|nr:hypothetical protein FN846DRAFT_921904 [Sphaerosporella brunnea]